jgi:hypothetical protein
MKKLRSKFFRVAVEGDTVDGREITRQDIQEMAGTYDPKVYGARIWPEHFRGLIPGGPFDALGDVVACKAEEIKDGSSLDGKLCLYAQVDALPSLVQLNSSGQKIYHSIEMFSNFAKTGKAYLFGLAVTDTPASLGTQVLAFGTDGGELLTGANHEGRIDFHRTSSGDETMEDETGQRTPSLFSKVKSLLGKDKGDADKRFRDQESAIEAIARHAAELEQRIDDADSVPREQFDAVKTQLDQLSAAHNSLLEKLNMTAAPGTDGRAPATGGNGEQLADF